MCDFEQKISEWRKQMLAAGVKSPVPLEELEAHLREEIERLVKSGLNEQSAFETSAAEMGRPEKLNCEFKKNERTSMKNKLLILAGILGVLVGAALIMPAAHLYNEEGMVHNAIAGFAVGIPIVLLGIGATAIGFKKRKA
jgi:hypothetical protein